MEENALFGKIHNIGSILPDSVLWVGSVIESHCPSVCMFLIFQKSHFRVKVFLILACDEIFFLKGAVFLILEIDKTGGFGADYFG